MAKLRRSHTVLPHTSPTAVIRRVGERIVARVSKKSLDSSSSSKIKGLSIDQAGIPVVNVIRSDSPTTPCSDSEHEEDIPESLPSSPQSRFGFRLSPSDADVIHTDMQHLSLGSGRDGGSAVAESTAVLFRRSPTHSLSEGKLNMLKNEPCVFHMTVGTPPLRTGDWMDGENEGTGVRAVPRRRGSDAGQLRWKKQVEEDDVTDIEAESFRRPRANSCPAVIVRRGSLSMRRASPSLASTVEEGDEEEINE